MTDQTPRRADQAGARSPEYHTRRRPRPDAAPSPASGSSSSPRRTDRGDSATTPRRRVPRRPEPPLPEGLSATDLDPVARRELRSLPKDLADRVAVHLVATGRLLDEDPAGAYAHAAYARDLASRVAATREAAGIAAYVAGDYAQALADLRAWRRMTGSAAHVAVMADCERGLGRPERALSLVRDPAVGRLDQATRVELRIVESGARRDLGEADAAVVALQIPELEQERLEDWTPRLWYAYADALLAAGRTEEALTWFRSTAAIDVSDQTDATERLVELGAEAG